ncbi:MAG: hypothetical protein M3R58_00400 [Pseudomonadota bacterium]|nr:hypothetical protein [Pseudomonadota bacterium]
MNSWLKELDRARTEAEVVATTRDYVSLWAPPELKPLPEDCRQIRIDTQADIARWRDKLADGYARARIGDNSENSERLHDLVSLVARASERLGEIRAAR